MSVWYAIPTANPAQCSRTFLLWKKMGYKTAALTDNSFSPEIGACDLHLHVTRYNGYGHAVNRLVKTILAQDPKASWIVTGGDDILPDPNRPAFFIDQQAEDYFKGTFGCMQPVGDPWNDYCCRKCAGSPWMGRELCERLYAGNGPMWPNYWHFYVDTELQEVCKCLGIFWQRTDLTQRHEHYTRTEGAPRPAYMNRAYSEGRNASELYATRSAAGFPGHAPRPKTGNVISYSLWGDESWMRCAVRNAYQARQVFPGWRLRVYAAVSPDQDRRLRTLGYEVVRMTSEPGRAGAFWRFFAASDSDLEAVIFRDVDSRLYSRDANAVAEWLDSGKACHVIADHLSHFTNKINAGLWGLRSGTVGNMRSLIGNWPDKEGYGQDEQFLEQKVWPLVEGSCLRHCCEGPFIWPQALPLQPPLAKGYHLGKKEFEL